MLAAFVLYAPWLCFLTVSAPEPRFARAFLNVLRKPAMSLPILLFATVDAKSPLMTAAGRPGGRRPFALVNSNGAQNFVNEAHGNLPFTHGQSSFPHSVPSYACRGGVIGNVRQGNQWLG